MIKQKYDRHLKEEQAYREIKLLAMMNHPNVISMYEFFESPKHITIIFNLVNGELLLPGLEKFKDSFTTKRILKIIMQLCRAVRHLKAKDIIWCNFDHENIIYDGEDVVICGFSPSRLKVSRKLRLDKRILGLRGNPMYASPEMINNKYYGLRHDVWGLGIISFFLFAGVFPFEGSNSAEICKKILYDEPDWDILYKRNVDPKIIELIQFMLLKDPNKRATIRQVMNNKIFSIFHKQEKLVGPIDIYLYIFLY